MIEVKDLVKKYGNHLAVDHLSFQLEPGRIYGFLGPNGAGKSTTMNMMTGYLGATEGEIVINGYNILTQPEKAKQCVGYLPELPPLYMEMKVEEYLLFVAELKGVVKEEREACVEEVMALTRLTDMKGRLIRNLSKGYRQRVGLAQAVLGFPEIIILDEPTVGLDPQQIIEIRDLIRQLAKNHTVILSSHILSEVQEICEYVLIISKGKLVASDTTENLEKLFGGAKTLELTVKASVEDTEGILREVPWVQKIEVESRGAEETYAKVEITGNEDMREKISLAFAGKGKAILMMKENQASLEDVFMELTQGKEEDTDAGDL